MYMVQQSRVMPMNQQAYLDMPCRFWSIHHPRSSYHGEHQYGCRICHNIFSQPMKNPAMIFTLAYCLLTHHPAQPCQPVARILRPPVRGSVYSHNSPRIHIRSGRRRCFHASTGTVPSLGRWTANGMSLMSDRDTPASRTASVLPPEPNFSRICMENAPLEGSEMDLRPSNRVCQDNFPSKGRGMQRSYVVRNEDRDSLSVLTYVFTVKEKFRGTVPYSPRLC